MSTCTCPYHPSHTLSNSSCPYLHISPCHHHIPTGRHPIISILMLHMPKPPQSTTPYHLIHALNPQKTKNPHSTSYPSATLRTLTSANRRRSDGKPLDGRHGVSGRRRSSSWRCITKCDTLSWYDPTRFCTTVRVSEEE